MVDLENTHNSPNTCPAPFRLRITNLTVNPDRIQSFLPRLAPGHELHHNGHGLGQTSAFGFGGSASRAQMCLSRTFHNCKYHPVKKTKAPPL